MPPSDVFHVSLTKCVTGFLMEPPIDIVILAFLNIVCDARVTQFRLSHSTRLLQSIDRCDQTRVRQALERHIAAVTYTTRTVEHIDFQGAKLVLHCRCIGICWAFQGTKIRCKEITNGLRESLCCFVIDRVSRRK